MSENKKVNIFYDTEFYENGETIKPISFGFVKENGESLYLVNKDFSYDDMVDDARHRGSEETIQFLDNNVFNNLQSDKSNTFTLKTIKALILEFVGYHECTFWTSTGSYDWVLTMQVFGRMVDKPEHFPYLAMDTAQLKVLFPQVKKDMSLLPFPMPEGVGEHNALYDAYEVYAKYLSYQKFIKENNIPISI